MLPPRVRPLRASQHLGAGHRLRHRAVSSFFHHHQHFGRAVGERGARRQALFQLLMGHQILLQSSVRRVKSLPREEAVHESRQLHGADGPYSIESRHFGRATSVNQNQNSSVEQFPR